MKIAHRYLSKQITPLESLLHEAINNNELKDTYEQFLPKNGRETTVESKRSMPDNLSATAKSDLAAKEAKWNHKLNL